MPEQMIIWQNLFIQKNCWQESGQSQERRRHRQISKLKMGNVTLDRAAFELSTSKGSFRLANKNFRCWSF